MGLGRRKFLEYLSIAVAGVTLDPFKAVAVTNDVYINNKFGFVLTKPENWDFIAVKEFGRLKKRYDPDRRI